MMTTATHTGTETRFERGRDWCVASSKRGYQAINPMPVEALDRQ